MRKEMNKTIHVRGLYSVPQAAELLGLSKSRVYTLVKERRIEANKSFLNGRLLVRGSVLQKYKDARQKLDEF